MLVQWGFILNAPIVIVQLYLKPSFLFLVDASTDGTQWSKVGLLNVGPFYNLYMASGVHYKPHGPRLDFIISLSFDLLVLCGVYIYDFNGNYFFHLTNHLYDIIYYFHHFISLNHLYLICMFVDFIMLFQDYTYCYFLFIPYLLKLFLNIIKFMVWRWINFFFEK